MAAHRRNLAADGLEHKHRRNLPVTKQSDHPSQARCAPAPDGRLRWCPDHFPTAYAKEDARHKKTREDLDREADQWRWEKTVARLQREA